MSRNNLKTHYSAKKLLSFSLSAFPNSVQGIIYQAKKQGWKTQKRVGRGGGVEYALTSLPKLVQEQLRMKHALAQLPEVKQEVPAKASLGAVLNNATDSRTHIVQDHNALRVVEEDVEELDEFEQGFQKGVAK